MSYSNSNLFLATEKVKNAELLPLGTRVVRGPDWKWKNQDTAGPGTVIQHSRKDSEYLLTEFSIMCELLVFSIKC